MLSSRYIIMILQKQYMNMVHIKDTVPNNII